MITQEECHVLIKNIFPDMIMYIKMSIYVIFHGLGILSQLFVHLSRLLHIAFSSKCSKLKYSV